MIEDITSYYWESELRGICSRGKVSIKKQGPLVIKLIKELLHPGLRTIWMKELEFWRKSLINKDMKKRSG